MSPVHPLSRPVHPPRFGAPIARYSPGVQVPLSGGASLLFVSGQVATDEHGRTVGAGDAEAQARQVFHNLRQVLEAAGGTLAHLVSVTIYVTDLADFDAVSAVRNQAFADAAPPSSTFVQVAGLVVPEHRVEISGVAVIPGAPEAP